MVDIQSAMAENRRGKNKEDRKKKPQDKNIMACPVSQGGHNKSNYEWRTQRRSKVDAL